MSTHAHINFFKDFGEPFVLIEQLHGLFTSQVPHAVAQQWSAICDHAMNEGLEDTGPVLGHLNIGTKSGGQGTQISLTLDNEATKDLPQEYSMKNMAQEGPAVFAFSDTNGHMACEGIVQHRIDVLPRGRANEIDPAYRKLSRQRDIAAASRTRTVQVVTGRSITNIRQPVAAAEAERRRKAAEEKRSAMPKEELEATLFRLFERQSYWSLAQLQKQTSQPTAHLRSVLAEIANKTKRGPYKDMWSLKKEFRVGDRDIEGDKSMDEHPS